MKNLKQYTSISKDKFAKQDILAEITDLKLSLGNKHNNKLVINDTGLKVREGEILGIIGESGSGKTILSSTLTGINSEIQVPTQGKILVNNIDVTNWGPRDWQESRLRGRFVSQVFQNPLSSLNPYNKIGHQIVESILVNSEIKVTKKEAYEEAISLLESVMIHNPSEVMEMYPHQMSGGMNQRIVIVTILAAKPKLIIFDEPTTALDPVAQAQIIEIIREIRAKTNTAMILISHDIGLVASIADTMAIMYAGKIVEEGTAQEIINFPLHPYTWGLLMSIPEITSNKVLYSIPGVVPNDISIIKGDPFAPRNDYALNIDSQIKPPRFDSSSTHVVYSWLYNVKSENFTPPKMISERWNTFRSKK